ncbi:MAG: BlaI/MecI/CopY family transcriptional regulator [Sellimonas intestinalis]
MVRLGELKKRQLEVMDVLWEADEPMIASEIVKAREDLNVNTVQAALRSLVKKNYIEVADIVYSGTVLSRRYKTLITKEDYTNSIETDLNKILHNPSLFAHYIDQIDDLDLITRLEGIINKRKEDLSQ